MAKICQYAENTYFGKPCGLLDQLTSAVGGVIFANFADPCAPEIEKIHAAGLLPEGVTLCVTDTRQPQRADRGIRGHSPGNGGCGGLSGPECVGRVRKQHSGRRCPGCALNAGIELSCGPFIIIRKTPGRWPRRMPCNEETLRSFCISSGQMAIPRLSPVRTSTAPPTRGIRG